MAGWSIPEDLSNGFIDPSNYTTPEIICHLGATPGGAYATVAAGDTVQLEWTPWPESHKGPVIDYLASCNGDCTTVDKTTLLFNKIDGVGLVDGTTSPGTYASDKLIAANNTWTITIPSSIAAGNYVLRHEIIALHSAETANGAQNYPQCVNLKVTGSGTDSLATGTLGEQLYTSTDAGILINIYQPLASYSVPGPALLSGAASGASPSAVSASSVPVPSSNLSVTAAGSTAVTATPISTIAASSTSDTAAGTGTSPGSVPVSTALSAVLPTTISSAAISVGSCIPAPGIPSGMSTVVVPASISSAIASLASALPVPSGVVAPVAGSGTPASLTFEQFLAWLVSVYDNMFRSGKVITSRSTTLHARALHI